MNVYPAEVEAELVRHAAVADAAVIGVPHATWGEVGVAFIVAKAAVATAGLTEELASFFGGRLAKYKLPREFIFVGSLPRTAYGKVVKAELKELYERRGMVD